MSDSEEKQKKNYDHLFKVILTGDAKVGKTSLKRKYVDNSFSREYQASSGIDFAVKNITVNEQKVKLHVFDTPGNSRDGANQFYRSVHAVVIVFDVTDQLSFKNVLTWQSKAIELCPEGFVFLIGTKTDLKEDRKVTSEDAEELSKKLGISYAEVSVKDNRNVSDVFANIAKTLIESKSADRRGRTWWNKK